MKRKSLFWCALLVVMSVVCGVSMSACKKPQNTPPTDSEVGVYSGESSGQTYTLTLSGEVFTLAIDSDVEAGVYLRNGQTLVLTFTDGDTADATYADGTVTLDYDGKTITLVKQTTTYRVTFDSNGGSEVSPVTVVGGKPLAEPTAPTRSGHVFLGWFTDRNSASTRFRFGVQTITQDTTLYAHWVEIDKNAPVYTVRFDLGYAASAPAATETVNGKVYNLPTPTRNGYTFKGWWGSMYDDGAKPSYSVTEGETAFVEDTTLYALWEATDSTRLTAPTVTVGTNIVSWPSVSGANGYHIEVTGPAGSEFAPIDENVPVPSKAVDFASAKEGDYIIKVTAVSTAAGVNDSPTATVYYKNKALGRVWQYRVEGTELYYNEVAGADAYYIVIDCGDKGHTHTEATPIDNGKKRSYDFGGCKMQPQGITFTVIARKAGMATGTPKSYTHTLDLGAVDKGSFSISAEQVLSWGAVQGATEYIVTVTCADSTHHDGTEINVGNRTNISLQECPAGDITVTVTPSATGYNAPQATTYTFRKEVPETPTNVRISEGNLVWDPVAGATSYRIDIDGDVKTASTASYSLASLADGKYAVKVCAVSGNLQSPWSAAVVVNKGQSMDTALQYEAGKVVWSYAFGATKYVVDVNGETTEVNADQNSATVVLTKKSNKIQVAAYNGDAVIGKTDAITVDAYKITFDSNEGAPVEPMYKHAGDPLTLPTITRNGFNFNGWYRSPSNGAKYTATTFNETDDITLYAYWSLPKVTIVYEYGSGKGDDRTGEASYGEDFVWEVPTSDDATLGFVGWYSRPNGSGTRYTDTQGKSLAPWRTATGATVYAHFVEVLSFRLGGDGTYGVSKAGGIDLVETVYIPQTYKGRDVTAVDDDAFNGCANLKSIYIPNTIKTIATVSAFTGCSELQDVVVYEVAGNRMIAYRSDNGSLVYNNSVTRQVELVYIPATKAGDYVVPDGVTTISLNTFNSASRFTSVTVPASVTTVAANAFNACPELTAVTFAAPAAGVAAQDLILEDGAFKSCGKLTTVNFPSRLKNFSAAALNGCNALDTVTVAAGGDYAAADGMLLAGTVLVYCPVGKSGKLTIPAAVREIGENAFAGCNAITEVEFGSNVTVIHANAFAACKGLETITFTANTSSRETEIGAYAFSGCTNLATVTFAENCKVVKIGDHAFDGCSKLTGIAFPASLRTVGDYAFGDCAKLQTVALGGTDLVLGQFVFNKCAALTTLHLPKTVKAFNATVIEGCPSITEITVDPANPYLTSEGGILYDKNKTAIHYVPKDFKGTDGVYTMPNTITAIGDGVFKGKTGLTQVVLSSKLTSIGAYAFDGCTNLKTVTFGDGTVANLKIGAYAFNACSALTSFAFPADIVSIGAYAFYKCGKLNITGTVTLNAVTEIGDYAFAGAYSSDTAQITKLVLGNALTKVGEGAFMYSRIGEFAFTDAAAGSNVALTIGKDAFRNSTASKITLPNTLIAIGDYAFRENTSLTAINIPNTVGSIGASAFTGCTNLVTVTFAAGNTDKPLIFVESTDDVSSKMGTFSGCKKLQYVNLPERLTRIAAFAFRTCEKLERDTQSGEKVLTIPATVQYIGSGAFSNCDVLSKVEFAEDLSKNSILTFGDGAFSGSSGQNTGVFSAYSTSYTKLDTVQLPRRLKVIPAYTFSHCAKLKDIMIWNTVEEIGVGAFYYCNALVSTQDNNIFELGNNGTPLTVASGNSTSSGASSNPGVFGYVQSANFTYVKLPERIVNIGAYMFCYCNTLATVEMPKSIRNVGDVPAIGEYAFNGCSVLASATFYGSVPQGAAVTIGASAFSSTKLTSFDLPSNLSSLVKADGTVLSAIGSGAFNGTTVKFTDNSLVLSADKKTLLLCPTAVGGAVTVPATVETIAENAFRDCVSVTGIAFETGSRLTSIGANAFYGCTGLATVDFDNCAKLETIGDYAFYGCANRALTAIEIPASVQSIGDYAFTAASGSIDWKLASVTFAPNSKLTSIGAYAFANNTALQAIALPSGLQEIGDYAFYGCTKRIDENNVVVGGVGITSIEIPSSVTHIGNSAFENCWMLETVTFAPGGTADLTIGNRAFYGYVKKAYAKKGDSTSIYFGALESIVIPARTVSIGNQAFFASEYTNAVGLSALTFEQNSRLTTIGDSAFEYARITSLTLPQSVTTIGNSAFGNSLIESLTLSAQLTSIGESAFAYTNITSVTIPQSVKSIGDSAFSGCASLGTVAYADNSQLTSMGKNVFRGCTQIASYGIPANLVSIDNTLFDSLPNLEAITVDVANPIFAARDGVLFDKAISVLIYFPVKKGGAYTVPGSVLEIDANAFKGKTGLTSVIISEGVTTIGANAFQDCTGITSVTLPQSLWFIGEYAFAGCTSLGSITVRYAVTEISAHAFDGCSELTQVTLPDTLHSIGEAAFKGCTSLNSITLPDGIEDIGANAFQNCTSLSISRLPTSLTAVSAYAFAGCTSIQTLAIHGGIKTIGSNAFAGAGIVTLTLNEGLTDIGSSAFSGCGLTSLTLPDSTVTIGSSAFANCPIAALIIPDNVTTIGNSAFENTAIASITFSKSGKLTTLGDSAFAGCTQLTEITLPGSIGVLAPAVFNGCTELKRVTLSEGITGIANAGGTYGSATPTSPKNPFYNCPSLKTVLLPSTLTAIGDFAFYGFTGDTLQIPSSVTSIGRAAFSMCSSLMSIELPTSVNTIKEYTFYRCTSLVSIYLHEGITSIENNAFDRCTNLVEVRNQSSLPITKGSSEYGEVAKYAFLVHGDKEQKATVGGENNEYILIENEGKLSLVAYSGEATEIVLPDKINEKNYSLAANVFAGNTNIVSVSLPGSIGTVPGGLFDGCSKLKTVVFGEGITAIDDSGSNSDSLFYGCYALTSVTLPSTLKTVGDYAFYQLSSSVTLNGLNHLRLTTVGDYAFYRVTSLSSLDLSSLTTVGAYAFNGCTLQSVVTGSSLTTVGEYAFNDCTSLRSIDSTSLTEVGEYAFNGCTSLQSIDLSQLTVLGARAFYGCTSLTSVNLLNTTQIEAIPEYAFYNCRQLTSVMLPDSITSIGQYAFSSSSSSYPMGLRSIVIPDSVVTIDRYAFSYCKTLTDLEISENSKLETIGNSAFQYSAITTVYLPKSLTKIDSSAFYDCTKLLEVRNQSKLTLRKGSSDCGYVAKYAYIIHGDKESKMTVGGENGEYALLTDNGVTALVAYLGTDTAIVLPNTISGKTYTLAAQAFAGNTTITSVTVPGSIGTVPARLFNGCNKLKTVEFGEGITAFGDGVSDSDSMFGGCSSLMSVTLPRTLTSIGAYMFHSLPSGVTLDGLNNLQLTKVGKYAFYYVMSISTIDLSKLTELGESAFERCSALTSVNLQSTTQITSIPNNAFFKCDHLTEVTLPDSITSIGESAFAGTSSGAMILQSIRIPDNVETIGSKAFDYCTQLTDLEISENSKLKTIGSYAFEYSVITTIYLPKDLTKIDSGAFYECKNLLEVRNGSGLSIKKGDTYQNGYVAKNALVVHTGTDSKLEKDAAGYVFLDDETLQLLAYTGNSTELVLPASFKNKTYTMAANVLAGNTKITKVTVPGTVVIPSTMFKGCSNLTTVIFQEGITELPDGTSYDSLFYNCSSLTSVTLPSTLQKIGAYAFKDFKNKVTFTGLDSLSNLTEIGAYAFYGVTSFTAFDLGSVTHIGDQAFRETALTSVTIPTTVETMGEEVFSGCKALTTATFNAAIDIPKKTFYQCTALNSVTLADGVTAIGESAFEGTYSDSTLREIIVPDTVKTIGNKAFYYCKLLEVVRISDTSQLTSIGDSAFNYSNLLLTFTVPTGVTSIGSSAFPSASKLAEIRNLSALNIKKGENTFGNIAKNAKHVYNPTTGAESAIETDDASGFTYLVDDKSYILSYTGDATELTVPSTYKGKECVICYYAFYNNVKLVKTMIPKEIKTVESNAFYGCTANNYYVGHSALPKEWDSNWNKDSRPVIWGYDGNDHNYIFKNGESEHHRVTGKLLTADMMPETDPIGTGDKTHFIGWYIDVACANKVTFPYVGTADENGNIPTDVTLYALFYNDEEYEIYTRDGKTRETAFVVKLDDSGKFEKNVYLTKTDVACFEFVAESTSYSFVFGGLPVSSAYIFVKTEAQAVSESKDDFIRDSHTFASTNNNATRLTCNNFAIGSKYYVIFKCTAYSFGGGNCPLTIQKN